MTRAARLLNISQPALSQQLRSLEEAVGTTLVTKAGRGIELSEAGRYLNREASSLFERVADIENSTCEIGRRSSREVLLGIAGSTTIEFTAVEFFAKARKAQNKSSITEQTLLDSDAVAALLERRVDGVISPSEWNTSQELVRYNIGSTRSYLGLPATHALAAREELSLEHLVGEQLVAVRTESSAILSGDRLQEQSLLERQLRERMRFVDSPFQALSLVLAGSALAVLPPALIGLRSDVLCYRPICSSALFDQHWFLYLRRSERRCDVLQLRQACCVSREPPVTLTPKPRRR